MKVGVSWQESLRGEIVPKWGEIKAEYMYEYYLHYLTKIVGELFGGFRKKLYLCNVNPERHCGRRRPDVARCKRT